MARKARRSRKTKKKDELVLKLSDYQFPGEKQAYWTAIGVTYGLFIAFAGFVAVSNYNGVMNSTGIKGIQGLNWWLIVNVLLIPLLMIFLGNYLATLHTRKKIKKAGRQAKVMPNNFGDIHKLLSSQASLAGMKLPHMYLLEDEVPYMYSIPGGPGTIVASELMRDAFGEDEFGAILAIEVGHVKSHHMSLELAIQYITNANVLWKVLLFPLMIIKFLASGWSDVAEYTADRCAALVLGGSAMINIAMVKRAAMFDKQADVSTEDLHAYLESTGDISTDAEQMERHFRIGNFITSQPNLHDRVETLNDFVHSEEGAAAFEKMAQIRTQLGIAQPETG